LPDPKNFGIKPPDFGTKCGASITEGLTLTEISNSLQHRRRPEAARFFYVTASPGFEGAPKMGEESV